MKPSLLLSAVACGGCCVGTDDPAAASQVPAAPAGAKKPEGPKITEIYIHRSPGYERNPPPYYGLTLLPDGTAIYVGETFAARMGTYKAHIAPSEFERIAKQIDSSGYFKLGKYAGQPVTDVRILDVSVVKGGKRKTIVDWMASPNMDHAQKVIEPIAEEIDAVVAKAKWKKVSDKNRAPDYSASDDTYPQKPSKF